MDNRPAENALPLTDDNGVRYTPILGGWRLTHPDGVVEYVYLNPSSDDTDGLSNVFVYHDNGYCEMPECYIAIHKEREPGLEGIVNRMRDGIDCTEDESVEILNYFTDNAEYLSSAENADRDQVVGLFPLEWDQWHSDREGQS